MSWASQYLKPQDDATYHWIDDEGGSWESVADFIAIGVFGFCGCGMNDVALRYMRDVMRLINEKAPGSDQAPFTPDNPYPWERPDYKAWRADHRARTDALFHNDKGAEFLAYYLLHDKDLEEHGAGTPGWLSAKGKAVLADLEALNLGQREIEPA